MNNGSLERLIAEGVSLWLDGCGRGQPAADGLETLVKDKLVTGAVQGIATLARALHDPSYERELTELAVRGLGAQEALRTLIAQDVRHACDVLLPVHEGSPCRDGLVSADLPRVPAAATLAESRAVWWTVNRPNLLIRIAPTEERLPVVADCLAEGIGVDAGPVFSPLRYGAVLDAFLDGLERAHAAGLRLDRICSVASFPLAPLDDAVDARLRSLGRARPAALEHLACRATARLAHWMHEQRFTGERWQRLADAGARPQRLLFRATDPAGRTGADTRHVDGFVAWGVVSAMSRSTLDATADHVLLSGDTLTGRQISARRDLASLAALGLDGDRLAHRLEREYESELDAHWKQLLDRTTVELEKRST